MIQTIFGWDGGQGTGLKNIWSPVWQAKTIFYCFSLLFDPHVLCQFWKRQNKPKQQQNAKKKQKQKQTNKQTNKQKTRRPRNENKSSPDNKWFSVGKKMVRPYNKVH